MKSPGKTIPEPYEDTKPFWQACKQHRLVVPKCNTCGKLFFYPRAQCPHCMGTDLSWPEVSGKGKIYSYSIVHTPFRWGAWKDDIPYVVALIDLREGVRMLSNLVECDHNIVRVGMDVKVFFDDITDEISLPRFRPIT